MKSPRSRRVRAGLVVLATAACAALMPMSTTRAASVPISVPSPHVAAAQASRNPERFRAENRARHEQARSRGLIQNAAPRVAMRPAPIQTLSGCGAWDELYPNTPSLARTSFAWVHDAVGDRSILFGGFDTDSSVYSNDVWILTRTGTPTWTRITPVGVSPSPRMSMTGVFDSARQRVVIFGGESSSGLENDVWALDLSGTPNWVQLAPAGTAPDPRSESAAIFDAPRDRMIVHGGGTAVGLNGEVWSLAFSPTPQWTQLSPTGTAPGDRRLHSAIFDAPRDRMIVTAGDVQGSNAIDVWSLSLSGSPAWTELLPSGTPPPLRSAHATVFDAPRNRLVLYGGYVDGDSEQYERNDAWTLSLTGNVKWTQLAPAAPRPTPASRHGAIYDVARQQLVTIGGIGDAGGQTWTLSLSTSAVWTQLAPAGLGPRPRDSQSIVIDPTRNRLVMIGGWYYDGLGSDEVWTFDLASHQWTLRLPTGVRPDRRYNAVAIRDAARDRAVMFGGYAVRNDGVTFDQNDLWSLALAGNMAWTKLNPGGTDPDPRQGHAAMYDPVRDRMVLHGGYSDSLGAFGDVHALSLGGSGTWSQLNPSGDPTVASDHIGVYDPIRDRFVLHDQTTTTAITFAGSPAWVDVAYRDESLQGPPAGVYDPVGDRLLVTSNDGQLNALSLAGIPAWSTLDQSGDVPPIGYHTLLWDPTGQRVIQVAGYDGYERNDVHALTFPATLLTVTATAAPVAGGVVERDPDLACYTPGSQVILTATANPGYVFDHWSGGASGSTNPVTVTVNSNLAVTAHFLGFTLTAAANPGGGGTLTRSPDEPVYLPGTEVTLTASPFSGHTFSGWSGDASGTVNPLVITMDSDKNIAANFQPGCGVWSLLTPDGPEPPGRNRTAAVFDQALDRMVVFSGNGSSGNDTWALSFNGVPIWLQLAPTGGPPDFRYGASAVFDPVRNRMLVFGGFGGSTIYTDLNDVWALNLSGPPAWVQLTPSGAPPAARFDCEAIYDPVRDRLIVFGGRTGEYPNETLHNDVWALSLSGTPAWTQLTPTGAPPAPRAAFAAAYDSMRDRLLVFGGWLGSFALANDTWALSLAGTPAWSSLAPGGPPPSVRQYPRAAYDPVRDRMVIFGGLSATGPILNDLHGLGLTGTPSWVPMDALAKPSQLGPAFLYDAGRDRLVLFGGQTSASFSNSTYVIRHQGPTLTVSISPASGGAVTRNPDAACYEPGTQVTLTAVPNTGYAFAGWSGDASGSANPTSVTMDGPKSVTATFVGYPLTINISPFGSGSVARSPSQSTYAPGSMVTLTATPIAGRRFASWSGDTTATTNPLTLAMSGPRTLAANFEIDPVYGCMRWTTYTAGTPKPSDRTAYAAAFDPVRRRYWMFGGIRTAFGTVANDWWSYDLVTRVWAQLPIAGTPPAGLAHASAIYDAVHDRLVLFGGEDAGSVAHGETWSVNLSGTPTWSQITTGGPGPSARSHHVAIHDLPRDRMLIHGGGPSGAPLSDVWALSLGGTPEWTLLSASLTRTDHGAIYDPVRDRMVVFAGRCAPGSMCNDVSVLPLADPVAFAPLAPVGEAPVARIGAMVAYDPPRDQMIVYGGQIALGGFPTEPWALKLSSRPAWIRLTATGTIPVTSAYKEAVYDSDQQAFVYNVGPASNIAQLSFAGGNAVEVVVDPVAGGTVTRSPASSCIEPGAELTLTATPNPGFEFVQWEGLGTQNPYTFTPAGHISTIALFRPIGVAVGDAAAAEFGLDVAPNPSFGPTRIAFTLPADGTARITVIDVTGREVARLAEGTLTAGVHSLIWNARTSQGRLAAGVYFARFEFGDRITHRRIVLLR